MYMTSLLNLTIVARHAVPPPYYGFYDATWWEAHKPSLAAKVAAAMPGTPIDPAKAPTHTTFVLHVAGSSSAPFDGLRLRTDLYVRGAMWRSYGHALCVSLVDPEDELDHACAKGGGVFDAKVWLFVPGNARPAVSIEHVLRARWPGAAAVRKPTLPSLGSATWHDMPTFAKRLHDVCAWTAPMLAESGSAFAEGGLAALIRKECAKVASASVDGGAAAAGRTLGDGQLHSLVGLADVLNEVAWKHARKSKVVMQVKGEDLQAVGAAFLLAASSLPQPFAIVESGNLCGGSTTLLALLRRRFCPSCPFYSVDPGWFRPVMGHPHSCARDTLAWAGLSAEVNFHDGPGASLTSLESPVGFVYLDDGKARYFKCVNRIPTHAPEACLLTGARVRIPSWQRAALLVPSAQADAWRHRRHGRRLARGAAAPLAPLLWASSIRRGARRRGRMPAACGAEWTEDPLRQQLHTQPC
jgi:predicted O-methyltransferase YrrM